MKKMITVILSALLVVSVFAGCSTAEKKTNDKLSIVTTVFPIYDWVRNIVGNEDIELTMLLDKGTDLHNYQPTADDMIKISDCDMFIYIGGESDEWAEDALENSVNENIIALNLLDVLGDKAKEEELIEGMQDEEEGEEEEAEYDEHIWLSLKNAQVLSLEIANKLGDIDSDNKALYLTNAEKYNADLAALDKEYENAVAAANTKTLLFGDRFPFRYMTEDYGLKYYAAFIGCSAETEASFETISFLARKTDELELKNIMVLEGSDCKIANTIIENTQNKNQKILALNSMQSTAAKQVEEGATYLGIMQSNLAVLKEALE